MATPSVLQKNDALSASSILDLRKGESNKSRGNSIEKKIEFLENLTERVSNRRARRWLNDRLLMELVPRLDAEEIRGLFAPPPWGDDVPLSPFCMTNFEEWDKFRNVDMDKQASLIEALENASPKGKKGCIDEDKAAVQNAWHRVDRRTRDALRRSFLEELITRYENCLRAFIKESRDDILLLRVEDPFHRLLLHGVCEFYNLVSVTASNAPRTTRIRKTKGCTELTNITLSSFLKMSKQGIW